MAISTVHVTCFHHICYALIKYMRENEFLLKRYQDWEDLFQNLYYMLRKNLLNIFYGRAGEELDEEEEEELEDGKIEKGTQEEEDEKDELEDGEIEEATREHVEEEEELEDREIEEATQQEEEEELDDGEIVQGISARGGGGTGRWEIVEDIQ
uniref:Uncharacterized protein n=1 Tax=Aegilops tauschii subsp. strangulata TaxID=200361 RepID=A0A453Q525_AEGTS